MKIYCVFELYGLEKQLIRIFRLENIAKDFINGTGISDEYAVEEWEIEGITDTQYIVEFVSYNGKYPNLCSGNLVLKVNSKEYKFPAYCLSSGGSAYFTNNYRDEHITKGPWTIKAWPDNFPEGAKHEAEKIVNDKVKHGCCGGCL